MAEKQKSTNPFLEFDEEDLIEDEIVSPDNTTNIVQSENFRHRVHEEIQEVTIDAIAAKLLKDRFLLTALEFHTELVESGRELPRFRDYFSNPSNFERTKSENTSPSLPRTLSVQTFDSLDFARYSDDGERQVDERVAVLEFELRKAQDVIKSLRASLTRQAESELMSPDQPHYRDLADITGQGGIRPLEKRAVNYLVNEYLLVNNYKLTSVTFCEENDDQDVEEWDDVGLNISKPPDLLRLYRDFGNHLTPRQPQVDASCQADICVDDRELQELRERLSDVHQQVDQLTKQVEDLKTENIQLQAHNKTLQVMQDVNLRKSSTPFVTPIHMPSKPTSTPIRPANARKTIIQSTRDNSPDSSQQRVADPYPIGGDDIDESLHFKLMDSLADKDEQPECDMGVAVAMFAEGAANRIVDKLSNVDESMQVNVGSLVEDDEGDGVGDEKGDAGGESLEDGGDDAAATEGSGEEDEVANKGPVSRRMSEEFRRSLMGVCCSRNSDNRIISEVSKLSECDMQEVIEMLTRCLPHIVPNVILAKREELIPLIVCAATLHTDAKHRDQLLNILFNLIKKPDEDQRSMMLNGCIAFASHAGPTRVEADLLPQCWEQINHKYTERRILVAEACGTLAPYIPHDILSSLVMSMLQQMLNDDRDVGVRQAVVKSLAVIISFIHDPDKYVKGSDLLMLALADQSPIVANSALTILLPSLAMWARELGRLEHDLANVILRRLEHLSALATQQSSGSVNFPLDETQFISLVRALQELLPFLFLDVIEHGPYMATFRSAQTPTIALHSSRFPKPTSDLTSLPVIAGDEAYLAAIVAAFEDHMDQEWVEPWEAFSWVVNNLIPRCIEAISSIDLTTPLLISVFSQFFMTISQIFGRSFAEKKVKARFKSVLNIPEEELDGQVLLGQTALTTCTVPVYAAGVLSAFNSNDDHKDLCQFLQTALCTLALCQAPLDSVKAAFVQLGMSPSNHEMLLSVLWDGVMHTSAQVRSASSLLFDLIIKGVGETQLSTRVVPALVTLANDPEITVRISTIPGFGTLIENVSSREMLDRIYMQLNTFLDDPLYRDHHSLHIELIRMFARVTPNAEPKFREDYVLPRLAAIAQENNGCTNDTKRHDITIQLFEAYSALACCFMNNRLIADTLLPGLRCLKHDAAQIAPEYNDVIQSMIRDYENKVDSTKLTALSEDVSTTSTTPQAGTLGQPHEDVRSRVLSRWKDSNISGIFTRKK